MNLCRVQKALWGEYLVLCEAGSWSELKSGSNILTCNEPRCETGLTEYARRSTFQFQIYANLKTSATRWRIVKWSKRRVIKGFLCCVASSRELSLLKGEKSEIRNNMRLLRIIVSCVPLMALLLSMVAVEVVSGRVLYSRPKTTEDHGHVYTGNIIQAPKKPCPNGSLRDPRGRCRKYV